MNVIGNRGPVGPEILGARNQKMGRQGERSSGQISGLMALETAHASIPAVQIKQLFWIELQGPAQGQLFVVVLLLLVLLLIKVD